MRNCTAGAAHSAPGTVQEGKLAEDAGFSFDRLREYKEEHGHCCPANDRTKDDNTTPPSRSKLVSS